MPTGIEKVSTEHVVAHVKHNLRMPSEWVHVELTVRLPGAVSSYLHNASQIGAAYIVVYIRFGCPASYLLLVRVEYESR